MKILKSFYDYLPNIPDEEPCITSEVPGSTNCLVFDNGNKRFCKVWQAGTPDANIAVIAHGPSGKGKIAIMAPDVPDVVVGAGKKTGFAIFLQRIGDIYNVSLCQDENTEHQRFFLTATKSAALTSVILTLLDRWMAPEEKSELILLLEEITND